MGKNQKRRSLIVQCARELARSGLHADHRSILRDLRQLPDFPLAQPRLEDQALRGQLDRLCELAREANASAEV